MNIETILRAERLCEANNAQKTPCGYYVMMASAEAAEPFVRELTRGCREHTVLENLPSVDAEDCGFDSATHEVHVHARVSNTVIVTVTQRLPTVYLGELEPFSALTECPQCSRGNLKEHHCDRCRARWCAECHGMIYTHQNNLTDLGVLMCFANVGGGHNGKALDA